MSRTEQTGVRDATSWRTELIAYVVITVVVTTGLWIGLGPRAALQTGGVLVLLTVALGLGRRRVDALRVAGGAGDERNRDLYTRSLAAAATVLAFVLPGWWLVTVLQGEPDDTLMLLWTLFGVTFLIAAVVNSRTR